MESDTSTPSGAASENPLPILKTHELANVTSRKENSSPTKPPSSVYRKFSIKTCPINDPLGAPKARRTPSSPRRRSMRESAMPERLTAGTSSRSRKITP